MDSYIVVALHGVHIKKILNNILLTFMSWICIVLVLNAMAFFPVFFYVQFCTFTIKRTWWFLLPKCYYLGFFIFRVYATLVMVSACLIHSEYSVFKIYELNIIYPVYLLPLLRKKKNTTQWECLSPSISISDLFQEHWNYGFGVPRFHVFF